MQKFSKSKEKRFDITMVDGSIKFFQFNQIYCQTIGIEVTKSFKSESKHLIFAISETIFTLALFGFLLYDAESIGEYGIIFFTLGCVVHATTFYIFMCCKIKDILKFIEHCETFCEKSKSVIALQVFFNFIYSNITVYLCVLTLLQ